MGKNSIKLYIIGFITGLINGLFGSGGGMIIVPALTLFLGLEQYKAHATAISIIFPLTIISTIIYFFNKSIPIKISLLIILGGLLGSFIGAKILNKIPNKALKKVFALFIIYSGIRMMKK